MISVDLRDPNIEKNIKSAVYIQKTGIFTDGEIQCLYDEQVKADKLSNDRKEASRE